MADFSSQRRARFETPSIIQARERLKRSMPTAKYIPEVRPAPGGGFEYAPVTVEGIESRYRGNRAAAEDVQAEAAQVKAPPEKHTLFSKKGFEKHPYLASIAAGFAYGEKTPDVLNQYWGQNAREREAGARREEYADQRNKDRAERTRQREEDARYREEMRRENDRRYNKDQARRDRAEGRQKDKDEYAPSQEEMDAAKGRGYYWQKGAPGESDWAPIRGSKVRPPTEREIEMYERQGLWYDHRTATVRIDRNRARADPGPRPRDRINRDITEARSRMNKMILRKKKLEDIVAGKVPDDASEVTPEQQQDAGYELELIEERIRWAENDLSYYQSEQTANLMPPPDEVTWDIYQRMSPEQRDRYHMEFKAPEPPEGYERPSGPPRDPRSRP